MFLHCGDTGNDEVSMDWILGFGRLSIITAEKYIFSASAISTRDPMREVFKMMKFGVVGDRG